MAGNPVIGVDVIAKLDGFRAELAKIPGIGAEEAQALAARMNKELRALTRAQATANKGMAQGFDHARGAAQNLQAQIFDIGTSLQGGQNPLTILAQQGPQVAQALMGAGGGMAALKAAMVSTAAVVGPIVVVLGAGYAAWKAYNEESDRAATIAANAAAVHKALGPILDDTRNKLVDLAEAEGRLSESEADRVRNSIRGLAQWRGAMDESIQKLDDLREKQTGLWTAVVDNVGNFAAKMGPLGTVGGRMWDGLTTSSEEYGVEIAALDKEIAKSIGVLGENVDVTNDLAVATDKATASKRAAADAEKEWAKAWRESLAIMAEDTQRVREVEAGLLRMSEAGHAAAVVQMDDWQTIEDATTRQLAALQATYQATALLADTDQQRMDALREFSAAKVEIQNAEAWQLQALREKQAEQSRKDFEREMDQARRLSEERIGYAMATAGQVEAIASEVAARGGEAAMFAAGVAKASAIFQIGVDTAAAIVKGMAIFGPPPSPPGIAAIVAATSIGAAQAALVASEPLPKFHSGGEVTADLLPGEFVVNRQGVSAAGRDQLHNMNAGISPQPTIYTVSIYRHTRQVQKWKRDGLSAGDPIVQRIDSGRILGHRTDRG